MIILFGFIIFFGCCDSSLSYNLFKKYDNECAGVLPNYVYRPIVEEDYDMRPEDIWYPCGAKQYKYNCIRNFLASNSECIPAVGRTPDPIRLPILQYHFPSNNLILTHTNVRINGFQNANIKDFYHNKATNNVVFTVHLPSLNLTSEKSYFTILRPGKEPIVNADQVTYEIYNATFTIVIPRVPHLRLEWSVVNFDLQTPPKYHYGPKSLQIKNPHISQCHDFIKEHLMIMSKECYFFHSYFLMELFIQQELCDFGVVPINEVGFLRNMRYLGETYPHYTTFK